MTANQNQGADPSGPVLIVLGLAAAVIGGLYAGTHIAALAVHHRPVDGITLNALIEFAAHLPKNLATPGTAWPTGISSDSLTGPIPFWTATLLVWALAAATLIALVRLFGTSREVGQDPRERFGAPAWPR